MQRSDLCYLVFAFNLWLSFICLRSGLRPPQLTQRGWICLAHTPADRQAFLFIYFWCFTLPDRQYAAAERTITVIKCNQNGTWTLSRFLSDICKLTGILMEMQGWFEAWTAGRINLTCTRMMETANMQCVIRRAAKIYIHPKLARSETSLAFVA